MSIFDHLPLADADLQAADRLVAAPPSDPLVLVVGRAAGLLAGQLAARLVTDPADRIVLEPAEGRWSTADIAVVHRVAGRMPIQRTGLVLRDGDSLTSRHYDQLLKTFEEPPAPTWFLLCLRTLDQVPPAIRGRAAAVLSARPAGPDRRARVLTDAGLEPEAARRVVQVCGGHVELEAAVAAQPGLLDPLQQLADTRAQGPAPVTRAHQVAQLVDELAAGLAEQLGTKTAASRLAVTVVLERWTAAATAALRAGVDADAEADLVDTISRFLAAVDEARVALERNVAPHAVLASVTAAG